MALILPILTAPEKTRSPPLSTLTRGRSIQLPLRHPLANDTNFNNTPALPPAATIPNPPRYVQRRFSFAPLPLRLSPWHAASPKTDKPRAGCRTTPPPVTRLTGSERATGAIVLREEYGQRKRSQLALPVVEQGNETCVWARWGGARRRSRPRDGGEGLLGPTGRDNAAADGEDLGYLGTG
jgi:hypothetical protein